MAEEPESIPDFDDETKIEEVDDLRMSRTEEPEREFKFKKFENLFVYDSQGNKIRFGDIYKNQKTLIFLVRHFMDFITQDYVEDIGLIPLEYLQAADARVVVIGPAPFKFIQDFKKETGLPYSLYCDPDRELYKALGLAYKLELAPLSNSKHIKQGMMMGLLRGMWKAMKTQEWMGDTKQQGGTFIFGPGNVAHFSHIDDNAVDHAPINKVLEVAGVQPVSFPKDPRIQML